MILNSAKKSFVVGALVCSFGTISINAQELTGDTRLACEAILCLSSGTRPAECQPALHRYFSIKLKKWKKTVKARMNFLKLCPVDGADIKDPVFADLRDNVLPYSDPTKCTAQYFNSHPDTECLQENCGEKKCICIEYKYKPKASIPQECKAVVEHQYTNIKPKNICSNIKWYSQDSWYSGQEKVEISKSEYLNLQKNGNNNISFTNKYMINQNINNPLNNFYKTVSIEKNCWVNSIKE